MLQLATPTLQTMSQAPSLPWANDEEAEEYARDPKGFLRLRCETWKNNARFFHNVLITATYYLPPFVVLPNGTKFYTSEKTQSEAISQGKVGLVIAKGPMAFVDCPELGIHFRGQNVEVGEWIQYDIHDPRQFTINRIHCRIVKDVHVIAAVDDPRLVY